MNQNWRNQAQNKGMDPKKLEFLNQFMSQAQNTKQDAMLPLLMSIASQANQKGMNFSNSETDMMLEILSSNMNPAEKQRMEQMRKMMGMMGNRGKK